MESDIKIPHLVIYGDSNLIINKFSGSYEVKKEDHFPYHWHDTLLLERFYKVFLNHTPRENYHMVYALANLATTMALWENESTKVRVISGLFLVVLIFN